MDASPFVIDKLTPHQGGILFYGSTELISKAESNTYRLTSATGLFDFTSFNLQGLEDNVDEWTAFTIPKITITSSTGGSQQYTGTVDAIDFGGGDIFFSYRFSDSGMKTLDWTDVEWVDFTTQYTKAKISDFVLATDISAVPEASTSLGLLALGAGGLFTRRRLKRAAWTV